MPPKKKKSTESGTTGNGGDWLASLARESHASDVVQSSSKRKGTKTSAAASHVTTTKEERIQRREQKKLERQERKRVAEEKRASKKLLLEQKKRKRNERGGAEQKVSSSAALGMDAPSRKRKRSRGGMTELSKRALVKLCNNIESTVSRYESSASSHHQRINKKKHKSSDQNDSNHDTTNQLIINGVPADPKGKATKSSTLRPDSKELQPRIRDYNGQGLVRPSLFLPLNDPSFVPKLELEFAEHIPGFFGKAKTKAAKKQSDENMLWRRCLKAKEGEGGAGGKKKRKNRGVVGGEDFEGMILRQDVM